VHSSQHDGGEAWRGKNCVVLGANNSAHDIAADLVEHGAAEVTMVQRSPTAGVTSDALMEHARGRLYSENALESGVTTEIADLTVASIPFRLLPAMQKPVYQAIRKRDAKLYEGLDKAGFRWHLGEDDAGIHTTYLRRGAGYYIDVGAAQLIIDGRIRLKSPAEISRIAEQTALLRLDGPKVDVKVLAQENLHGQGLPAQGLFSGPVQFGVILWDEVKPGQAPPPSQLQNPTGQGQSNVNGSIR